MPIAERIAIRSDKPFVVDSSFPLHRKLSTWTNMSLDMMTWVHNNMDGLVLEEYQMMKSGLLPRRVFSQLPLPKPHFFLHLPKTGGTTLGITARRNEVPMFECQE